MSKSKGNVVDPDLLIDQYGADTARLFSLFAAPPEKDLDWNDEAVDGCYRFLKRVWTKAMEYCENTGVYDLPEPAMNQMNDREKKVFRKIHYTIKKVTEDIEDSYHFNTAISAVMELVNEIYLFDADNQPNASAHYKSLMLLGLKTVVVLLTPFCPHIAEELWERLNQKGTVGKGVWPKHNEAALVEESIEIVVQINGKMRGRVIVPAAIQPSELEKVILQDEKISKFISPNPVKRFVHVPRKLVNVIV